MNMQAKYGVNENEGYCPETDHFGWTTCWWGESRWKLPAVTVTALPDKLQVVSLQ